MAGGYRREAGSVGDPKEFRKLYNAIADTPSRNLLVANWKAPTSGWSDPSSSALNYRTTHGYWWSSTVSGAANVYNLKFDDGTVYPEFAYTKNSARSVRCVKD